ncbi:MAG: hypothetical protein ACK5XB_00850 [Rhodospirillales bacterium]|jgi:hypothetical protein
MPMPTAAELHELREAWIRAPRGRRDVRAKALQAAMTKTLREELAPKGSAEMPPHQVPPHQAPADESGKPYWQRDQYA